MLKRILDIRAGEWRRLFPIVLTYAFVLSTVYMLKPARNALFLDRLGIDQLPYVLLLVALVGGTLASLYARLTKGIQIERLILATFLGLAGVLLGFYGLLKTDQSWVYYLFYVWVNLYGVLAISLLWLLANAVFHAREARRLFGFIGTGGIAGAVLGGVFTGWAADVVGTENLLLICVGVLLLCLLLLWRVRHHASQPLTHNEEGGVGEAFRESPLVRYMVGMGCVVAVVAAISDVQFNEIVNATFESKDEKTAFFGTFFAYLNCFAFVFQFFLTPQILKRTGVGGGLVFLPVSMGLGAVGVLSIPGLWGGIAVKVGDIGFRHSIHKSAFEVLFLPVPSRLKKRAKVFIDTTVDNVSTGLGAVLVLVLTGLVGLSYRELSWISLGVVVVWLASLWPLRKAYVDAFRQALERRELQSDEFRFQVTDGVVIDSLVNALASPNTRQISYALDLLAGVDRDISDQLVHLLDHPDSEIRAKTLYVLSVVGQSKPLDGIEKHLQDNIPEVRLEAMHYLQRHRHADTRFALRDFLDHTNSQIRSAALGYVAQYGALEEKQLIDVSLVGAVLQSGDAFERAQMATLLGVLNRVELNPFFAQLKEDVSLRVLRATVYAFGQMRAIDELFWLTQQLAKPAMRSEARAALALMGTDIVGILCQRLDDAKVDLRIRRHIPRVISDIPDQISVNMLLDRIDRVSADLGYAVVKALSKLRGSVSNLVFDEERVTIAIMQELHAYYDLMQAGQVFAHAGQGRNWQLMQKAIGEHQNLIVERLFRLLGLLHAPKDMYHAYLGITSSEKGTRAQALEFLDNVLPSDLGRHLLNLIDPEIGVQAFEYGADIFGSTIVTVEDGLKYFIQGNEPWLKACAMNCVEDQHQGGLVSMVQLQREHEHPVVAETAQYVLNRLVV